MPGNGIIYSSPRQDDDEEERAQEQENSSDSEYDEESSIFSGDLHQDDDVVGSDEEEYDTADESSDDDEQIIEISTSGAGNDNQETNPTPDSTTSTESISVHSRLWRHLSRLPTSLGAGLLVTLMVLGQSEEMSIFTLLGILSGTTATVHLSWHYITREVRQSERRRRGTSALLDANTPGIATGVRVVALGISLLGGTLLVLFAGGNTIFFCLGAGITYHVSLAAISTYISYLGVNNDTQGERLERILTSLRSLGLNVERDYLISFLQRIRNNTAPSRYALPATPGDAVRRGELQDRGIRYITILVGLLSALYLRDSNLGVALLYPLASSVITNSVLSVIASAMRRAQYYNEINRLMEEGISDDREIARRLLIRSASLNDRFGDFLADIAVLCNRVVRVGAYIPLGILARVLPSTAGKIVGAFVGAGAGAEAINAAYAFRAVIDRDVAPENVINDVYNRSFTTKMARVAIYTAILLMIFLVTPYILVHSLTNVNPSDVNVGFAIGGILLASVFIVMIYRNVVTIDDFLLDSMSCLRQNNRARLFFGRSDGVTPEEMAARGRAEARMEVIQEEIIAERARYNAAGRRFLQPDPNARHTAVRSMMDRLRRTLRIPNNRPNHTIEGQAVIDPGNASETASVNIVIDQPHHNATANLVPVRRVADINLGHIETNGSVSRYRILDENNNQLAEVEVDYSNDGRLIMHYANGHNIVHHPEGSRTEHTSDHVRIEHHLNGTHTAYHPDGMTAHFNPADNSYEVHHDGTIYVVRDNTIISQRPLGSSIEENVEPVEESTQAHARSRVGGLRVRFSDPSVIGESMNRHNTSQNLATIDEEGSDVSSNHISIDMDSNDEEHAVEERSPRNWFRGLFSSCTNADNISDTSSVHESIEMQSISNTEPLEDNTEGQDQSSDGDNSEDASDSDSCIINMGDPNTAPIQSTQLSADPAAASSNYSSAFQSQAPELLELLKLSNWYEIAPESGDDEIEDDQEMASISSVIDEDKEGDEDKEKKYDNNGEEIIISTPSELSKKKTSEDRDISDLLNEKVKHPEIPENFDESQYEEVRAKWLDDSNRGPAAIGLLRLSPVVMPVFTNHHSINLNTNIPKHFMHMLGGHHMPVFEHDS